MVGLWPARWITSKTTPVARSPSGKTIIIWWAEWPRTFALLSIDSSLLRPRSVRQQQAYPGRRPPCSRGQPLPAFIVLFFAGLVALLLFAVWAFVVAIVAHLALDLVEAR